MNDERIVRSWNVDGMNSKWPARRPLLMIGVVACAFLFGAARLFPTTAHVPLTMPLWDQPWWRC
jgi:hypothetical protein